MIGTVNCVYETPCGWCSKWDKECDKKTHTKPIDESLINKICKSKEDHEWEFCGVSTGGSHYRCKKCGIHKTETYPTNPYDITVSI